ncbi:hypothetical protein [Deinococcus sp.]|uniref:hypothetical protein n=1 Tax=Deinococcus sp. TaxID=47478 RepID=UPI0025E925BA|nr:hypothetical protein [Deinococcus sp.]
MTLNWRLWYDGVVAEWEFEPEVRSVGIDSLAAILENILSKLERSELIISSSMVLTLDEMIYYGSASKFDAEFFKSIVSDRGVYIEIFSDGVLHKLEKEEVVKEVHQRVINISIMYERGGAHTLTVSTNSYAWLPFDLLGLPQPHYYSVNAVRLCDTLAYIESIGMSLRQKNIVDKPYCRQSGYFLMNYFDVREHNGIESFILV